MTLPLLPELLLKISEDLDCLSLISMSLVCRITDSSLQRRRSELLDSALVVRDALPYIESAQSNVGSCSDDRLYGGWSLLEWVINEFEYDRNSVSRNLLARWKLYRNLRRCQRWKVNDVASSATGLDSCH